MSLFLDTICGGQKLAARRSLPGRLSSHRCSQRHAGKKHATKHLQRRCTVRAGPVEIDDSDLLQFADRANWYEAKFGADDMPDWIPATYLRTEEAAPGLRNVVLQHEISRMRVPIRNAYKCAGQRATVRVNNGLEYTLAVASPPAGMEQNRDSLFKLKGDIYSEEIKTVKEPESVMVELHVLIGQEEAPEVWELQEGDAVEVGPFRGVGLDLRTSAVCAIYRFPTVVMFVTGAGIATAKALLESDSTVPNLCLKFREDVRMYYLAPNEMTLAYKEHWESFEAAGCKVLPTTRSFQDAFDDDMTLSYEPEYTAAIILTGGDEEAEAAAREVCLEAEITTILSDSQEAAAPVYLSSNSKNFQEWATAG